MNIYVQGLNPRTRAESIQNYFEAIGRPAAVKDGILFNLDHTEALIIFKQKPGMYMYLEYVRNSRNGHRYCFIVGRKQPSMIISAVTQHFHLTKLRTSMAMGMIGVSSAKFGQ